MSGRTSGDTTRNLTRDMFVCKPRPTVDLDPQAVRLRRGLGAGVGSDCASGAGSATASASITFAASPARFATKLTQRIERLIELFVGHRLDAVRVLDLHLLGDYVCSPEVSPADISALWQSPLARPAESLATTPKWPVES